MVSNPKKFFTKHYHKFKAQDEKYSRQPSKFKQGGSMVYARESTDDKEKEKKKVTGDSGYNCHFCNGKNHLAKNCLLKMSREKMEEQLDEESELERRLAEIKTTKAEKAKKIAATATPESKVLMVQNENEEESYMEYWSTDSDDEEMMKPTHGGALLLKI